jgi:hypothetical protein
MIHDPLNISVDSSSEEQFQRFPYSTRQVSKSWHTLNKELFLLLRTELLCDTEEEAKHISLLSVSPIGVTAQNLWVKFTSLRHTKYTEV